MAWVLTEGLANVRSEFNRVFPDRDRKSDGSVGDLAHQGGRSGHNPDRTGNAEYKDGDALDEVRAIDVDKDLRTPGVSMEDVVQHLVTRARAGHYVPFHYIIYRRRIWSKSDGWVTHAYTGANAHDEHAHFSGGRTQTADNWAGSLGLASLLPKKEEDVAFTDDDGDKLVSKVRGTREFLSDTQVMLIGQDAAGRVAPALGRIEVVLARVEAALKQELADVAPSSEQNAAAVIAALGARVGETPETTAAKIRAALTPVLGDRADDVFRLLGEQA
jgi:hypothetical protein